MGSRPEADDTGWGSRSPYLEIPVGTQVPPMLKLGGAVVRQATPIWEGQRPFVARRGAVNRCSGPHGCATQRRRRRALVARELTFSCVECMAAHSATSLSGAYDSGRTTRRGAGTLTTYIHIGLQKTGTTFLQRSLHNLHQELARIGIIYPDTSAGLNVKGPAAHHFVPHAIQNVRTKYTPDADFSLLDKHVKEIKYEISRGSIGIVSSENFSLLTEESHIRQLRDIFPERNVKILVYLRRQDAWIDSLYGQMVKVGRKNTVGDFIRSQQRRLDYNDLIDRWATAFGEDNIVVRTYEPDGDLWLWQDFLTAIGRPDAAKLAPPFESQNDSLPAALTLYARNIPNDLPPGSSLAVM
jgi:hypothetical protein